MNDQEHWLDCVVCDASCIPSKDGKYGDGQEEVCLECATINFIIVDEDLEVDEYVARVSSDEETADVGQPLCDGSCKDFYGEKRKPCRLDCPRADGCGPLVELEVKTMRPHQREIAFVAFMAEANRIFQEEPGRAKKAIDEVLAELKKKDADAYFGCIRALQFFVKRLAPELGADELAQEMLREKLAGLGLDA